MSLTWKPITQEGKKNSHEERFVVACAAEELHCEKRFGWKCCYYAAGLCVQLLWEQDICGRDLCVSAFSLVCFIWAPAWINVRRLRLKSTPPCTIGISWSILSIRALVSVWKIKTSCAEILALHCQLPKGARSMNFLSGFVILLWHYSSCMFYSGPWAQWRTWEQYGICLPLNASMLSLQEFKRGSSGLLFSVSLFHCVSVCMVGEMQAAKFVYEKSWKQSRLFA